MNDTDYKYLQQRRQLAETNKYAFQWLLRLGEKHKERKGYFLSLSDYYDRKEDIETAAIIDAIIPEKTKHHTRYVLELRNIIGVSPFEFIASRRFTQISQSSIFDKGWVHISDLVKLFNVLWEITDRNMSLEYVVLSAAGYEKPTPTGRDLLECLGNNAVEKLRFSVSRLTLTDGMGRGLWNGVPEDELFCPLLWNVKETIRAFYPMPTKGESIDDVLRFIGYEKPVEFLYSYFQYQSIKTKYPKEIKRFEKLMSIRFRKKDSGFAFPHGAQNFRLKSAVREVESLAV